MATIDESFHLTTRSRWARFQRDLRLVRFLMILSWRWIVAGGRVRRAYRRAVKKGETLPIDVLSGQGKYR